MGSPSLRRAAILLLLGLMAGCGHSPEADDPQAAAGAFFAAVARGDTKAAYASAAFGFQALQTPEAFRADCQELGLIGAAPPVWTEAETKDKQATLAGVVTNNAGKALDLTATLLRDRGAWRLYALRPAARDGEGAGANRFTLVGKGPDFHDVYHQPMPAPAELNALAQETMGKLAEAIRTRSFDALYQYVSQGWRDGTLTAPNPAGNLNISRDDVGIAPDNGLTLEMLSNHFGPFIQKGADLTGLVNREPVFDLPPQIDSDGFLTLQGHFRNGDMQGNFRFRYVYELPKWRLCEIGVNVIRK